MSRGGNSKFEIHRFTSSLDNSNWCFGWGLLGPKSVPLGNGLPLIALQHCLRYRSNDVILSCAHTAATCADWLQQIFYMNILLLAEKNMQVLHNILLQGCIAGLHTCATQLQYKRNNKTELPQRLPCDAPYTCVYMSALKIFESPWVRAHGYFSQNL